MRDSVDTLASALVPELEPLGLELFDVQLTGSGRARVLQVLVDKDGGVDLEAITAATERISPVLDRLDVVSGPFALEVSSPGLERPLRRPEHYRRAIGETVSVKVREGSADVRRVRGEFDRRRRRRDHHRVEATTPARSPTTTSSRRAPCSSGVARPDPARVRRR